MADDFHDALSALVAREVNAARKAGDDDRLAGVVADLSTQLGKSIAIVCDGNPALIDKLLIGADGVVVQTATETGGLLAKIHAETRKGVQK